MILASILIGPPGRGVDLPLPPMVQENIASLRKHHPGTDHRLFSDLDIRAFLASHFPPDVRNAYDTLRPPAYKADLARYCIMHELGGIYADLSHLFLAPVPFDGAKPFIFRDMILSAPWDTSNSVFAVPPKHKALALAIEMVCANVKRRYYGPTYLCPTGPTLFGKAWATTCDAEEIAFGHAAGFARNAVTDPRIPLPSAGPVHCLMIGPRVAIVKRKRMGVGGLSDLGVMGSDNYVDRWKARQIYHET